MCFILVPRCAASVAVIQIYLVVFLPYYEMLFSNKDIGYKIPICKFNLDILTRYQFNLQKKMILHNRYNLTRYIWFNQTSISRLVRGHC